MHVRTGAEWRGSTVVVGLRNTPRIPHSLGSVRVVRVSRLTCSARASKAINSLALPTLYCRRHPLRVNGRGVRCRRTIYNRYSF